MTNRHRNRCLPTPVVFILIRALTSRCQHAVWCSRILNTNINVSPNRTPSGDFGASSSDVFVFAFVFLCLFINIFLKPSYTVHLVPALVLYRRGFPAVQRDRGILRNTTGHPSLSFPRTSFHCPAFSWQRFNWILLLVFSWPAEFLVWHKRLLWQESWLTLHQSLLPLVLFHCTCFKSSHSVEPSSIRSHCPSFPHLSST